MKHRSVKLLIALVVLLLIAAAALVHLLFNAYLFDDREYDITGLKLEQDGFDLHVKWNAEDCEGYHLIIFEGMGLPVEATADTNSYTIENIVIGTKYKIIVSAVTEDGTVAGAQKKQIKTKKLRQQIKLSGDSYKGFAGDAFQLGVEGEGKITFKSHKDAVASVDAQGLVSMKKSGRTELIVRAAGDDNYRAAEAKVKVTVFPETLRAPTVSKGNVTKTTGTIKWSKISYATEYEILRENPATGEYEVIQSVDGDTQKCTMARDHATYKVRAVITLGDKRVESDLSNSEEITAYGEKVQSYRSAHDLKNLNQSNMEQVAMIQKPGAVDVPQSMCFNGKEYIITYVNHGGTAGALQAFDRDGNRVRSGTISGMGHANGSTYNPNTGKIYTVKTHKSVKSRTCAVYDEKDFSGAGTFSLPRVTSGIAYDVSNNKYYLSKGNEIYVCDDQFNVEKYISKRARYNHAQDIGAYNGVVLVCTWVNGNKSYIDLYRVSDKAYLGSYNVSIGEIESCLVDDGYLVILMNMRGTSRDYIYRTKERIEIP